MTGSGPDLVVAIDPRPDPDDAAALVEAVTTLLAGEADPAVPTAHRSRWRAAGTSEAVDDRPVLP